MSYCWFKTSEGVTFRDRYLVSMSRAARAAGILSGGYHFAHPCLTSATAEARLWVSMLRAADLDDREDLRPAFDVEYGGCSTASGTRRWIVSALAEARRLLPGIKFAVYSGNWWLGPKTDCLFRHLPRETLSWISGYPNAVAPCGRSAIDVHQFTSSGRTGPIVGDVNRLVRAGFDGLLAGRGRVAPPLAEKRCRQHIKYTAIYLKLKRRLKEQGVLHEYGTRKLEQVTRLRRSTTHYFVKNHDEGKTNYDCHGDGHVTVRVLR